MKNKKFKTPAPWIVVTGLDGAGQKTLIKGLLQLSPKNTFNFHLPYSEFVLQSLKISGKGKPMSDTQTDRLAFALDARLANYHITEWRKKYNLIISKRGWMDNFFHGKIQGLSYSETNSLLQTRDLQKPSGVIYMVADPAISYQRIKDNSYRDKFETLSYMKEQYKAIIAFHRDVQTRHRDLVYFFDIPNVLVDTTELRPDDVLKKARIFLKNSSLISVEK